MLLHCWFILALTAAASEHYSLSCSLNGVSTSTGCKCDPQWEGLQCQRLAFAPGSHEADINSPWAAEDMQVSTWGMGTLQRPINGEQHVWGSEFTGSCGVSTYWQNSQACYAVMHLCATVLASYSV